MENSIVQSVFCEVEKKSYEEKGTVRAFAVKVESVDDFLECINFMVTPINPSGFFHYFYLSKEDSLPVVNELHKDRNEKSRSRAKKEMKLGKNIIIFNEDVSVAYPLTLQDSFKLFTGIKVMDYKDIPRTKNGK